MKVRHLLLLAALSMPDMAAADFSCTAEIRYKWTSFSSTVGGDEKKEDKAEPATPQPDADAVFWNTIQSKGATEDEAKARLQDLGVRERANAERECRSVHEDQTACIARKYAQNTSALNVMSFSQRKEFEKKLMEDCERSAGKCAGSVESEPKCRELVDPNATPTPAADAKGKEGKKK